MDDLIELFERATPAVAVPNVAGLTRRARARSRRRRACVVTPLLAIIAIAGVALRTGADRQVATTGAHGQLGTWRRTSTPPLDLTAQVRTATLRDGRIVVVAGSFDVDVSARPFETALYEPNTDAWTRLATAPVAPHAQGADLLVANDRVVLVTHDDSGHVSAALLDGGSLQWRAISIPGPAGHVFNAWAWDGTTFVLARFGDDANGASSGPPVVERWSADTDTWRQGTAPPTAPRFMATVARATDRFAVWGGATLAAHAAGSIPDPLPTQDGVTTPTTAGSGVDRPRRVFTDGAIYDIAHDSWTYLPPEPALAEVAKRGAGGVLTTSTLTLVSSQVEGSSRVVVRYEHGRWNRLPSPTAVGQMFVEQETATIAVRTVDESGPQPAQYIDGAADGWRAAPAYQLAPSANGLLAISATGDGPGNSAFSVWRLDGQTWTAAPPAPFTDRMEPGLGVSGDQLLVIGGESGPNLDAQPDAWLLDLSGSAG